MGLFECQIFSELRTRCPGAVGAVFSFGSVQSSGAPFEQLSVIRVVPRHRPFRGDAQKPSSLAFSTMQQTPVDAWTPQNMGDYQSSVNANRNRGDLEFLPSAAGRLVHQH